MATSGHQRRWESLRAAIVALRYYRAKSALTIFGVAIGVGAIVAIFALLQGLSSSITADFDALGSNSLTVRSKTTFAEQMQGKVNRLSIRDYDRLKRDLDGVASMTPVFSPFGVFGTTVRAGNQSSFTRINAVTPDYQDTYNLFVKSGRFFTPADERARRKVAVVGDKVRKDLWLLDQGGNDFIQIGDEWYKVVGVMEPKGEILGFNQDDFVLLPFSTGEQILADVSKQDVVIAISTTSVDNIEEVQARAGQLLRSSRKLPPGAADDFSVETAEQLSQSFERITDTVTLVAVGLVSISLLVGGVGIMNMMLVSVTERTTEIGICKALGARRSDILMQFLFEAIMLSVLGGVIGIAFGYGSSWIASALIPALPDPNIPLWAVFASIGFCAAVGVVFGVIPAANAASLEPIEALRRE